MSTKREARKQRSEAHREAQVRARRQHRWKSRTLIAVGALTLLTLAFLVLRRKDAEGTGRVWSPEHGHYHDR
jgi:hypothetical protein